MGLSMAPWILLARPCPAARAFFLPCRWDERGLGPVAVDFGIAQEGSNSTVRSSTSGSGIYGPGFNITLKSMVSMNPIAWPRDGDPCAPSLWLELINCRHEATAQQHRAMFPSSSPDHLPFVAGVRRGCTRSSEDFSPPTAPVAPFCRRRRALAQARGSGARLVSARA